MSTEEEKHTIKKHKHNTKLNKKKQRSEDYEKNSKKK